MTPPPPDAPPPPPELRFLKWLVIVLTGVMIAGIVAIVTLLVVRLGPAPTVPLPDRVELPEGARAAAVTLGADWLAVVTDGQEILIYDRDTGALRQRIVID